MFTIKGFMANEALFSNIPQEVYQFGELSTRSLTYAKEKGFYSNPSIPDIRFVSFISKDQSDVLFPVPTFASNHLLAVGQYLYNRYNASTITTDTNALISEITAQFNSPTVNISLMEIVNIAIDFSNNTKRLPEYIHWIVEDVVANEIYDLYVWFGDQYFATQYTDFEIVVIPPIPNVNNFYGTVASLDLVLAGITQGSIINQVDNKSEGFPYTHLVSRRVRWHEHFDFGTALRDVEWTFLIYGTAGLAEEFQFEAIRNFLANPFNTNLPLNIWQTVFPRVYETSEYFVIPYWEQVSTNIPTPIYRAMSKPASAVSLAVGNIPLVADQLFLETNTTTVGFIYQGIMGLVIGSPSNTSNLDFNISNKFPDYIDIPLTHPDAGRMSPDTQEFVTKINQLIQVAETLNLLTPLSQLPVGVSRVQRAGKVYASGTALGTRYFVITKLSYTAV